MQLYENPFKVYIEDFEAEAESFLKKYKCEEAITTPPAYSDRKNSHKIYVSRNCSIGVSVLGW